MTQLSNVYSAYDASGTTGVGKGNREDLQQLVSDISPTDTPILTALGKTKASAVLHEWTTGALRTAAANEKVEGDQGTIDAAVAKTRYNNRTAITNYVAGVTKTQQAVDKVGIMDALAEEVAKGIKTMKRDQEVMIHANTAKVAGDDSTARKTAGIPTWLIANVSAIGANPTGDGSNTATDGTQRALTEDMILSVSQSCYTNGGEPTILDVGAFNKRVVSSFPGNQTRHVTASAQMLINSIDVYEDDFNKLKVVPNRFALGRNAVLWDTDQAKIANLRGYETWDLGSRGSSMEKQIETEWALEVTNPGAHGIVRDLLTA
jgi:hypothetical protein